MEVIDQQFDEVLKFLAQSIGDHGSSPALSSTSLSSISLLATPNSENNSEVDNSKNTAKSETKSENSSKSSGIGDEIYDSASNNESPVPSLDAKQNQQSRANFNNNLLMKQSFQNKRNSSDSAFVDTMPVATSFSMGMISNATQSKNDKQISSPIFLHSSLNIPHSVSSGNSSAKSPNSQSTSTNSFNSNLKAVSCLFRITSRFA